MEAEDRWALYQGALGWWHEREIDTAYLRYGPWFSVWRVGSAVRFRWTTRSNESDGTPVFLLRSGQFEMTVNVFERAASSFCNELVSTMAKRVDAILRNGWTRNDCRLDIDALVKEQQRRELRLAAALRCRQETEWEKVRVQMQRLRSRISRSAESWILA